MCLVRRFNQERWPTYRWETTKNRNSNYWHEQLRTVSTKYLVQHNTNVYHQKWPNFRTVESFRYVYG